jgi:hypothetical protein
MLKPNRIKIFPNARLVFKWICMWISVGNFVDGLGANCFHALNLTEVELVAIVVDSEKNKWPPERLPPPI